MLFSIYNNLYDNVKLYQMRRHEWTEKTPQAYISQVSQFPTDLTN